ncbi:MAG TPA: GAF domain-containing protein [Microvirga sp.]
MEFPTDPNEMLRLRTLGELRLEENIPDAAIDRITAFARAHFKVATCLVTVIEAQRQLILSHQGFAGRETPRDISFCTYTILQQDVLVVADSHHDPRFRDNPFVRGEPFIRFYAGAPLTYEGELRLGSLCLIDPKPRSFSRGEQAELVMLAEHVVSVLVARTLNLPEPDLDGALSI